jgi:hypothetical protein
MNTESKAPHGKLNRYIASLRNRLIQTMLSERKILSSYLQQQKYAESFASQLSPSEHTHIVITPTICFESGVLYDKIICHHPTMPDDLARHIKDKLSMVYVVFGYE